MASGGTVPRLYRRNERNLDESMYSVSEDSEESHTLYNQGLHENGLAPCYLDPRHRQPVLKKFRYPG